MAKNSGSSQSEESTPSTISGTQIRRPSSQRSATSKAGGGGDGSLMGGVGRRGYWSARPMLYRFMDGNGEKEMFRQTGIAATCKQISNDWSGPEGLWFLCR